MNVLISDCTLNFIYLVLIVAFIWFIFPFIKCAFKSKCRKEHLVPVIKVFLNFTSKENKEK